MDGRGGFIIIIEAFIPQISLKTIIIHNLIKEILHNSLFLYCPEFLESRTETEISEIIAIKFHFLVTAVYFNFKNLLNEIELA